MLISHFNCIAPCNSEAVPSAKMAAAPHRRLQLHRMLQLHRRQSHRGFKMDALAIRGPACNQGNRRSRNVIQCSGGMRLVFVSAEVSPWTKTGGLGDILGGLPPSMAAMGHRVMTISPCYDQYNDAWDTNVLIQVNVGDRTVTVRLFHCYKGGVDHVFVDHPWFLAKDWGKTAGKLYGPTTGVDYQDNQLRFSLLCQAALEAPRVLNLNNNQYFSGPYGEDVVFIANMCGNIKFNASLAQKILAGADFLLIPSRFEPWGLVQLQAMKHGTVCNVPTTGVLADTIRDGFRGSQMGPFNVNCQAVDPADIRAPVNSVRRSSAIYRRGCKQPNGWTSSVISGRIGFALSAEVGWSASSTCLILLLILYVFTAFRKLFKQMQRKARTLLSLRVKISIRKCSRGDDPELDGSEKKLQNLGVPGSLVSRGRRSHQELKIILRGLE